MSEEYLCPNCCTPWKCNGPHIPEDVLEEVVKPLEKEIERLNARIKELDELAANAFRAWDADNDSKVGKILRAMTDENFRKSYLPKG